jgi:hypothetical protein
MLEHCVFDPETGQFLTGSLTDYCLARAHDLPAIEFDFNVVPCRTNPLGVKGPARPVRSAPRRRWSMPSSMRLASSGSSISTCR